MMGHRERLIDGNEWDALTRRGKRVHHAAFGLAGVREEGGCWPPPRPLALGRRDAHAGGPRQAYSCQPKAARATAKWRGHKTAIAVAPGST